VAACQERKLSQSLIAVEPTLDYQNIAPRSWEYSQQKRIALVPVHDLDRPKGLAAGGKWIRTSGPPATVSFLPRDIARPAWEDEGARTGATV
jgi:hypothetical protein